MKTYSIYLSSSSALNVPNQLSNGGYNWAVDWNSLFGGKQGFANVRYKFICPATTTLNATHYALRCDLPCNTSLMNNGLTLGCISPVIDPTQAVLAATATPLCYLEGNTLNSNGTTINIPLTSTSITVWITTANEYFSNYTGYFQLWLYFDVYE